LVETVNLFGSECVHAAKTFLVFGLCFFTLRIFTVRRYWWRNWWTAAIVAGGLVAWLLFYGDGWSLLTDGLFGGYEPRPLFDADGFLTVTRGEQVGLLEADFWGAIAGVGVAWLSELWAQRQWWYPEW
jgi:hypothetical protein